MSDKVQNGYPPGDNWGYHGAAFTLSTSWTQYTILVKDLNPLRYSMSVSDGLTWPMVRGGISAIQFANDPGYGMVVDEQMEFYLDDLRLHGLSYDTFGFTYPQP